MKHKSAKKKANKKKVIKPIIYTESDFEIKKSKIPGIGMGLFPKVNLKKGDHIGFYTGKILDDDQANSDRYVESRYLLWICKDWWIYGEGKQSNYTRYINHSEKPNAELIVSVRWKTARFIAMKAVKAGDELFFDYGKDYWDNMDFKPKAK
ncbi:SET domain-containing protein [Leptospira sp. GIMC2001]|uniref:SET domain-containing protein n=1 Tax=Leptospira sp. GIMC2001 TaxID=1513297 RepID=UPI00234A9255|nr:SET domain-containing protein-lysine N-methyltransferase [Leptospira sp. GIMC2001]WCL48219.1 SET domain-containing protein-lysine N-methyltransferase [Leptospira sp. GIMC2001]